MSAPATLSKDFFDQAPQTLPADFQFEEAAALPVPKTEQPGPWDRMLAHTRETLPKIAGALTRFGAPTVPVPQAKMGVAEGREAMGTPVLKPSLALPQEKGGIPLEAARGIVEGIEGLSSADNAALLLGIGGAGAAAKTLGVAPRVFQAADMALSAYFTGAMGTGAYEAGKDAWGKVKTGDYPGAARSLGLGSVSSLFALLAGKHTVGKARAVLTGKAPAAATPVSAPTEAPVATATPVVPAPSVAPAKPRAKALGAAPKPAPAGPAEPDWADVTGNVPKPPVESGPAQGILPTTKDAAQLRKQADKVQAAQDAGVLYATGRPLNAITKKAQGQWIKDARKRGDQPTGPEVKPEKPKTATQLLREKQQLAKAQAVEEKTQQEAKAAELAAKIKGMPPAEVEKGIAEAVKALPDEQLREVAAAQKLPKPPKEGQPEEPLSPLAGTVADELRQRQATPLEPFRIEQGTYTEPVLEGENVTATFTNNEGGTHKVTMPAEKYKSLASKGEPVAPVKPVQPAEVPPASPAPPAVAAPMPAETLEGGSGKWAGGTENELLTLVRQDSQAGRVSTSSIQRKYRVGYGIADRVLTRLKEEAAPPALRSEPIAPGGVAAAGVPEGAGAKFKPGDPVEWTVNGVRKSGTIKESAPPELGMEGFWVVDKGGSNLKHRYSQVREDTLKPIAAAGDVAGGGAKREGALELPTYREAWRDTQSIVDKWRREEPVPGLEAQYFTGKSPDTDRGYARYLDKRFSELPERLREFWMRQNAKDAETGETLNVAEHGVRGSHVWNVREGADQQAYPDLAPAPAPPPASAPPVSPAERGKLLRAEAVARAAAKRADAAAQRRKTEADLPADVNRITITDPKARDWRGALAGTWRRGTIGKKMEIWLREGDNMSANGSDLAPYYRARTEPQPPEKMSQEVGEVPESAPAAVVPKSEQGGVEAPKSIKPKAELSEDELSERFIAAVLAEPPSAKMEAPATVARTTPRPGTPERTKLDAEAEVLLAKKLRPIEEVQATSATVWQGNVAAPGRFVTDGKVLFDSDAIPGKRLNAIAARASSGKGTGTPQASVEGWFGKIAKGTEPVETLGQAGDLKGSAYFVEKDGTIIAAPSDSIAWAKSVSGAEEIRSQKGKALVFYRDGKPVAAVSAYGPGRFPAVNLKAARETAGTFTPPPNPLSAASARNTKAVAERKGKLTGAATRKAEVERRKEFYKPGNVVESYGGGLDKVLEYNEKPDGTFSVKVQAVKPDGSIDPDYPQPRVHSTPPEKGEKIVSTATRNEAERGSLSIPNLFHRDAVKERPRPRLKKEDSWLVDLRKGIGRPIERIAEEGRAGAELAQRLDDARDFGEVAAAKRLNRLREAGFEHVTKDELWQIHDQMQGIADATSSRAQAVAAAATQGFDEAIGEAMAQGATVRLRSGKVRPVMKRTDYFPQTMASEKQLSEGSVRADIIENMTDHLKVAKDAEKAAGAIDDFVDYLDTGRPRESTVQLLIRTGQAKSRAQATSILLNSHKRFSTRDPSLEYAREINLPFYDPNPARVLPDALLHQSLGAKRIEHLGQYNVRVDELVEEIVAARGDADYVRYAAGRILGTINEPDQALARTALALRALGTLKMTTSALRNVLQGPLNTWIAGDFRAMIAGARHFTKQGRKFGHESGAAIEAIIHEVMRSHGAEGKFVGGYLRLIGMTGSETWNRLGSSVGGADYVARMHERLRSNPKDGRARSVLERYGLNPDEAIKKPVLDYDELLLAGKKFSDRTQGRSGVQDLPLKASTAWGRLIVQFKPYSYNLGKMLAGEIIGEAKAGRFGPAFASLLVALIMLPLAEEGYQRLRDVITGRKPPDEGYLTDYLGHVIGASLFGPASDAFQAARYGRLAEWAIGAEPASIARGVEAAMNGKESFKRWAYREIPIFGNLTYRRVFPPKKPSARYAPLGKGF